MKAKKIVEGKVILDKDVDFFQEGRLFVRILEVSFADAPSTIHEEQVISPIHHQLAQAEEIPFYLEVITWEEKADYTLFAHLSKNGMDQIQSGDYITTESYPVLNQEISPPFLLVLQKVKR